jgi:putative transposase
LIDTQRVKTTEAGGERGYDAGKKINGRKRHIVVDTVGNLLEVVVHSLRRQLAEAEGNLRLIQERRSE